MPTANAAQFPAEQVVITTPEFSRYKTNEASVSRRYSNKWSASFGGGYTKLLDFALGFISAGITIRGASGHPLFFATKVFDPASGLAAR